MKQGNQQTRSPRNPAQLTRLPPPRRAPHPPPPSTPHRRPGHPHPSEPAPPHQPRTHHHHPRLDRRDPRPRLGHHRPARQPLTHPPDRRWRGAQASMAARRRSQQSPEGDRRAAARASKRLTDGSALRKRRVPSRAASSDHRSCEKRVNAQPAVLTTGGLKRPSERHRSCVSPTIHATVIRPSATVNRPAPT
jgi:hypothetical protein